MLRAAPAGKNEPFCRKKHTIYIIKIAQKPGFVKFHMVIGRRLSVAGRGKAGVDSTKRVCRVRGGVKRSTRNSTGHNRRPQRMETEETEETEYHGKRSVIGAYTPGYAVASQCDGEAQLRFLRKTPLYSVLLLSPALAANDRVPNNHAPPMSDLSDLSDLSDKKPRPFSRSGWWCVLCVTRAA